MLLGKLLEFILVLDLLILHLTCGLALKLQRVNVTYIFSDLLIYMSVKTWFVKWVSGTGYLGRRSFRDLHFGYIYIYIYQIGCWSVVGYALPKFTQLTVTSYYAASSASHYGISLLTRRIEEAHTTQTRQERLGWFLAGAHTYKSTVHFPVL